MGTIEYISSCIALAGIAYITTLWTPCTYPALLASAHTQMLCPDIVIKHSVKSNLTTGVEVRDACSSTLNVIKY